MKSENIHITIKFLGDTETEKLANLNELLAQELQNFGSFKLRIHGYGYFGSRNFPRVIWLGLDGEVEKLGKLAMTVEKEAEKIGAKKERFSPHITIGRVKSPDNSNYLISKLEECRAPDEEFLVDRIYIKESVLRPDGPIYKNIYEIPIIGG